jgi:hypothetical protein
VNILFLEHLARLDPVCGVESVAWNEVGDFGIKMNVEMPRDSVALIDLKRGCMEG